MNRLQFESSPYLLQHAHNPVDWYAWKPEAFERARAENKPIILSIGYSTCHWCHVMERESFENQQIADLMNQHFINIKVDREERPDIDHIYMEACQVFSGAGGWPLNCFLTPDGRPFYIGTYFPPQPAYNRPSWIQVLAGMADAYANKNETVERQADQLVDSIKKSNLFVFNQGLRELKQEQVFTPVLLSNIFQTLKKNFDTEYGGFGGAPKFPGSMALHFLLEYHHHFKDPSALEHVVFSLDKMIGGGIYDQLGGGFARYATDRAWLIPHFEKMLYDNALLVGLLADTYKVTRNEWYKTTIEETLDFIAREMTSPEGGFFAALDADSEGVEGKFYVWTQEEVSEVLANPEETALFYGFYDVTAEGNWEEVNILWRPQTLETYALTVGLDPKILAEQLKKSRQKLFAHRAKRIRPSLDDKILLGWNALMCTAYTKAFSALGKESYRLLAVNNMHFLLEKFQKPGEFGFFHTYKPSTNGVSAQYEAYLDDYAYLIEALLNVAEISEGPDFLRKAADLVDFTLQHFLDVDRKLFYFTNDKQQDVLLRTVELYDNAVPSGNSTMTRNLLRLGKLLDRPDYVQIAVDLLQQMAAGVEQYPSSFARWASVLTQAVYPGPEIAIIGPHWQPFADGLNAQYLPFKAIQSAIQADPDFPLLAGKNSSNGETQIYVCKNYTCQLPVQSIEAALKML